MLIPHVDASLRRIEAALDKLMRKMDFLEHHLEHEMVAAEDHVQATVAKLREQEGQTTGKVVDLEDKVLRSVEDSIIQRVNRLETSVIKRLKRQIGTNSMRSLDKSISAEIKVLKSKAGGGWLKPFIFVMGIQGVVAYYAHRWWKKFQKTHML